MAKFLGSRPQHREWMLVISDDYEYHQEKLKGMVESGQLVWVQCHLEDDLKSLNGISAMEALQIVKVYRDWWNGVKKW